MPNKYEQLKELMESRISFHGASSNTITTTFSITINDKPVKIPRCCYRVFQVFIRRKWGYSVLEVWWLPLCYVILLTEFMIYWIWSFLDTFLFTNLANFSNFSYFSSVTLRPSAYYNSRNCGWTLLKYLANLSFADD